MISKEQRQKNKDFAKADSIRDELSAMNISIMDTALGVVLSIDNFLGFKISIRRFIKKNLLILFFIPKQLLNYHHTL